MAFIPISGWMAAELVIVSSAILYSFYPAGPAIVLLQTAVAAAAYLSAGVPASEQSHSLVLSHKSRMLEVHQKAAAAILCSLLTGTLLGHTPELQRTGPAWMAVLVMTAGMQAVRFSTQKKRTKGGKALIIGAGSAGTLVARELINGNKGLIPAAFLDDDPKKQKKRLLGIPVAGTLSQIEQVTSALSIEHIIIAIPSLNEYAIKQIASTCAHTKARTQILPKLEDILTGRLSVTRFRELLANDLLEREAVSLDIEMVSAHLKGKVVLVTGAGGSIGSEICRQIIPFQPKQLILLGHGENSIYSIEMELMETCRQSGIELAAEIADIQDEKRMHEVMRFYRPNMVYHAAAHKHVPLMERNPEEAVKNNILGTLFTAKAAASQGAEGFVLISSDKAVNPTSVMGASKRLAEMIIQDINRETPTKFAAVRFGNVLGSRGSVIPLFRSQIEKGGPVTITHPDMVRYFMTIPEAARLVLQAGTHSEGGEIFILNMGEPVKIIDLAKNLITHLGYRIEEIGIVFTGVRPGEKLYEELLNKDEILDRHIHPHIYIGKNNSIHKEDIEEILDNFQIWDREVLRGKLLMASSSTVLSEEMPITS